MVNVAMNQIKKNVYRYPFGHGIIQFGGKSLISLPPNTRIRCHPLSIQSVNWN